MDSDDFAALLSAVRDLADRHQINGPADLTPDRKDATAQALREMGLLELRAGSDPAITVQEAAVIVSTLAESLLGSSLLGPGLLASEVLRRLAEDKNISTSADEITIAVPTSLRLADAGSPERQDLVAWDCLSARRTIAVDAAGHVRLHELGDVIESNEIGRELRTVGEPIKTLGRLTTDDQIWWRAYAFTLISAEMVGVARALHRHAVDYAGQRSQYGRRIGAFQAVAHLLADGLVSIETADSTVHSAAWALDSADLETASRAATVAKAYVGESAVHAVETAMQVFGGIAQTWEHHAHLHLRRVLFDAALLATSAELYVEAASWRAA